MQRKVLFLLWGLLVISLSFNTAVWGQQVFKTTKTSTIAYLEYLPQGYHSNSDKYPIVIFLHGIGERGANTTDTTRLRGSVQKVAKFGPPYYAGKGTKFPFILISPQLKDNYTTWPVNYIMEVINYVKTNLRVDEKRIYLTGLSLGGGGAWLTAQDYPELFAALAPVCGGSNSPSKACALAAENLPVWAFHGDRDKIVRASKSIAMVDAINHCRPQIDPPAKMTLYPGVAHNAWDYAYKPDHSVHDTNVYEWMLSFTNTTHAGNKLPFSDAGSDKTIPATSTSIVGSGRDLDGVISGYQWAQLSGPSMATLSNKTSPELQVSGLEAGKYVFSLQVTDDDGGKDTDYVEVTKTNDNQLPLAAAGPDTTLYLPGNVIKLFGTGSDPDGVVTGYSWNIISGPDAILTDANSKNLTMSELVEGTYVVRLTVTDDKGAQNQDTVQIFVKDRENVSISDVDPPILNDLTEVDLEDCQVTIFNGAGERIFSGGWSLEMYRQIFIENGLYLYQVTKNGKRIDSGRIYFTR